jgi:hypothetical protein
MVSTNDTFPILRLKLKQETVTEEEVQIYEKDST